MSAFATVDNCTIKCASNAILVHMITSELLKDKLLEKRNELIRRLYEEGYNFTQIGFIFKLAHSTILRIVKAK